MRPGIECLHDELIMERDHVKIKSNLLKTKRTFNLEGWVPEHCEEAVNKVLEASECCYEYRDPDDEEEVPVMAD